MADNIVTTNEKYAEDIGKEYGRTDNMIQAALLNGFAKSLKLDCGKDVDRQICTIVGELTPTARAILKEFAGMIEAAEGL